MKKLILIILVSINSIIYAQNQRGSNNLEVIDILYNNISYGN